MKSIYLWIKESDFQDLMNHLLPSRGNEYQKEEAAFMLAKPEKIGGKEYYNVFRIIKIKSSGFRYQSSFYLELEDHFREELIIEAHRSNASIVEIHSHPGPYSAAFSQTDLAGLEEFVPHVRWRLGGKPYFALVAADSSFDALVWSLEGPGVEKLDALVSDEAVRAPTNITFCRLTE